MNELKEKLNQEIMLDLFERLNEINDGSFVIDDRESVRKILQGGSI